MRVGCRGCRAGLNPALGGPFTGFTRARCSRRSIPRQRRQTPWTRPAFSPWPARTEGCQCLARASRLRCPQSASMRTTPQLAASCRGHTHAPAWTRCWPRGTGHTPHTVTTTGHASGWRREGLSASPPGEKAEASSARLSTVLQPWDPPITEGVCGGAGASASPHWPLAHRAAPVTAACTARRVEHLQQTRQSTGLRTSCWRCAKKG